MFHQGWRVVYSVLYTVGELPSFVMQSVVNYFFWGGLEIQDSIFVHDGKFDLKVTGEVVFTSSNYTYMYIRTLYRYLNRHSKFPLKTPSRFLFPSQFFP